MMEYYAALKMNKEPPYMTQNFQDKWKKKKKVHKQHSTNYVKEGKK